MENFKLEKTPTQKPKTEKRESHNPIDKILKRILEDEDCKELGAGEDGIVFRVPLKLLSREELLLLVDEGILEANEVDTVAVKILKIYRPPSGEREFEMQKRAHEILFREESVARIPNTTTSRDQHLGEIVGSLNVRGAKLKDNAELIVMDYIDGKDFGTMMYDFALKKLELGYQEETIANMTYSLKEQIVGIALGFEKADPASGQTAKEINSARAETFNKNEEILFKYLKKEGFKVDPSVFMRIENALKILNKNGIYHNDLHKQNVMIGSDGEVYIIDFGRADSKKNENGIPDGSFSFKWKGLSLTQEEDQEKINAQEIAAIKLIEESMQSSLTQKEHIRAFVKDLSEKGDTALNKEFLRAMYSDSTFERFLVMLHVAGETEGVDKEMIKVFTRSLVGKGLSIPRSNNMKKLQKLGYLNK